MDEGLIASRYSEALLRYVLETGGGDAVCAQAALIEKAITLVPEVRELLDNPEGVSLETKMKVFRTALQGEEPAPELERFLRLVIENDRMPQILLILHDFIGKYHKAKGIIPVRLVTAIPPSEEILSKFRTLVRQKTGYEALISVSVDPALIGGYVFEIEDYTLDASVRHQLDVIRSEFIDKNRRIV